MRLRILLPTEILIDANVQKVSAESAFGSFTLLPKHIDYMSAIVPGILSYLPEEGEEVYLAVDQGSLVKKGPDVLVSLRRAVRGPNLEELHRTVREEFMVLDEREKKVQSAAAKIEANFVRRFLEIQGNA